jgi:hypothetical protein
MTDERKTDDSPAALVAIARAAHLTGDRDLERAAKQWLAQRLPIRKDTPCEC